MTKWPWLASPIIWCAVAVAVWLPPAACADLDDRWLSVCLLKYAGQSGDVEGARRAADRLAARLGDKSPLFAGLAKALGDGSWEQVLPAAERRVRQFGATFSYTTDGSPLADLARRLSTGLSSGSAEQRQALATVLAEALPDRKVFGYLAAGIAAARLENERYATTSLRGQRMAEYARDQLAELARQEADPAARANPADLAAARARWTNELDRGRKLLAEGAGLRPIQTILTDLEAKLLKTIDEMEAIGDL